MRFKSTLLYCLILSSFTLSTGSAQVFLWPGDINDNGIVNGKDVLRWGYAYGATGPGRLDDGSVWTFLNVSPPWSESFPGETNFSYGDCDGSGRIDLDDVRNPITDHFGNTHGVLQPDYCPIGDQASAPQLTFTASKQSYPPGARIDLDISLGNVDIPAMDFYGITFQLNYNRDIIRPGAVTYTPENNGWFDPDGTSSYSFFHNTANPGIVEIAVTRTNQVGVDGFGKLGTLSLVLRGNIDIMLPGALNLEVDLVQMINSEMEIIPVYYDPDVTIIIADDDSASSCPKVIDPVCGSNGVTYINSCYAEAAGITEYTQGVCYNDCIDPELMRPDSDCETAEAEPVCGCNNITYSNPCLAEAAGITAYTSGPCQTSPDDRSCYDPILVVQSTGTSVSQNTGVITLNCPADDAPVCGCNGITFPNACVAEASGIAFYTPGSCNDDCIDPTIMEPEPACEYEYDPVCGCNGITYSNACTAEAAGVIDYSPGPCGQTSDWCAEAIPIQCGDFLAQETTVGAGNQIDNYPGCLSQAFKGPDRVYVFDKKMAGDLQIGLEILTPDIDLDLFLLSGNCSEVSCIAASTTNNKKSNNEGIILEDAPLGTYYIVVDAQFADVAGRFRLEVNCGYLYCGNDIEVNCGVPFAYNNSFGEDDVSLYTCSPNVYNVENNGPEVVHYFTTTTAGMVDISLTGLSANLELFLLGACDRGACLQYSQNPGTSNEIISTYLEPGTYYVVVDGYNGATSDYNLLVNCENTCNFNFSSISTTPSTCTTNNGTINLVSSGGTPGYIVYYSGPVSGSFSTSNNSATVNYLPSGTYLVKKIDARGCEVEETVTVNSTGSLQGQVVPHDAICSEPGYLSVSLQDGQGPYRVFLSGPDDANLVYEEPDFDINGLAPGTYDLYILDAQGCSVSKKSTIQEAESNFTFSLTAYPAGCGELGYVQVTTQNGKGPYSIQLNGPVGGNDNAQGNTFQVTKLPGGTYRLTVKDDNGCSYTDDFTIGDINLELTTTVRNGICGREGEISVQITNGTGNYTISWTGPENGSINTASETYVIPGLASGDYQIEVEDANQCTGFEVAQINNSGEQLSATTQAVDGTCGENGALLVTINNGSPPFTIRWEGPSGGEQQITNTNYTIPGLADGLYNLSITDVNNCQAESSEFINIDEALSLNLAPFNGNCGQDGSIRVNLNGGQANYIISWEGPENGSASSGEASYDVTGLASGSYQISVTDARGCVATGETSIENAEGLLQIGAVAQAANCDQSGLLELSVSGGQALYQVSWEGPESGEAATDPNGDLIIPNLPAGNYQLSAIDQNGCTGTSSVVVEADSGNVGISLDPQDPVCTQPGRINVIISNGSPDYSVSWEGPENGVSFTSANEFAITDLPPGAYKVSVADVFGCTAVDNVTLVPTGNLSVSAKANGAACGQGNIEIDIAAGTPAFDIRWEGPVNGSITTNNAAYTVPDLPDGTYLVSVTDLNGCNDAMEVNIFSGSQPEVNATPQAGNCGAAGNIGVSINGGAPDFTIQWTGPVNGSRTQSGNFYNIPELPSGSYTIELSDAKGCVDQITVALSNNPSDLEVSAGLIENECGQQNTVEVSIAGGAADYTLEWTGPQNGNIVLTEKITTIQDLPAGNYQVKITDANGCDAQSNINVPAAPVDLLSLTAHPGNCGQTGRIAATITGGTPSYTLAWSGPVSGSTTTDLSTADIPELPTGNYSVVLTDANGCSETAVIELDNDQTDLEVALALSANECGQDHNIRVSVSGGLPSYTVNWTGPENGTASTPANGYEIENLSEGNYTVNVTDQNGCTLSRTIRVEEIPLNILRLRAQPGDCGILGQIRVNINGGDPGYDLEWEGPVNGTASTNDAEYFIPDLPAGAYTVTLNDMNGCTVVRSVNLQGSSSLEADIAGQDGTCTEIPVISINITSGAPGYSIGWNGPVSGTFTTTNAAYDIPGLTAGTYEVSIIDAKGCERSETVTVAGGESNLALETTPQDGACGETGAVNLTINGGNPNFFIEWSGPVSGSASSNLATYQIDDLPDGAYSISVTDDNGCQKTTSAAISNQSDIDVNVNGIDGVCGQLGSIRINYNGVPPYTVTWTGPRSGSQGVNNGFYEIPNLVDGAYEVEIADNNGCTLTRPINIQNSVSDVDFSLETEVGSCNDPGSITVNITGGVAKYFIQWTSVNAQGSIIVDGPSYTIPDIPGGNYSITVRDGNGCKRQRDVQLPNHINSVALKTALSHPSCEAKGSITLTIKGDFPGFDLAWSGPSSGSDLTGEGDYIIDNLEEGVYDISVTDVNGCTQSAKVNLKDLVVPPNAFFTHTADNLSVAFNYNNATGTYLWDFGDGNTSSQSSPVYEYCDPGTYQVCLTVTNGCGTDNFCTNINVSIPDAGVLLDVGESSGSAGSTVQVPVTVDRLDQLLSLQGSIKIEDETVAKIKGLSPGVIFPQYLNANRTFSYSQNDQEGVTLQSGDILFYIDVEVIGALGESAVIRLVDIPTAVQVGGLENGQAVTKPHYALKGRITVAEADYGTISGRVTTYWGAPIPDASVHLTGSGTDLTELTDADGRYQLPNLDLNQEYTISAGKDIFPFNGLSTYSLFIGQRFILGMEPEQIFSPYQIIAGDADCNSSFTTLDLFLIQQLIVGATDDFVYCPSWVFLSEDNPMPTEFDAYNVFPYLDSKTLLLDGDASANFVGVKVGDILGEANPEALAGTPEVEIRNPVYLDLWAEDRALNAGETVDIALTAETFADMASYQFSLDFDSGSLQFSELVKSQSNDLANVVAGTRFADTGQIAFSWFSSKGEGVDAMGNEPLFALRFEVLQDIATLSEHLEIKDLPVSAEAHTRTGDPFKLRLVWQGGPEQPVLEPTPFRLYQNIPNPARKETRISFDLPEDFSGDLLLHDNFGRIIYRESGDFAAGRNDLLLPVDHLPSGVYYYTLKAGPHTATRSMVVVK